MSMRYNVKQTDGSHGAHQCLKYPNLTSNFDSVTIRRPERENGPNFDHFDQAGMKRHSILIQCSKYPREFTHVHGDRTKKEATLTSFSLRSQKGKCCSKISLKIINI